MKRKRRKIVPEVWKFSANRSLSVGGYFRMNGTFYNISTSKIQYSDETMAICVFLVCSFDFQLNHFSCLQMMNVLNTLHATYVISLIKTEQFCHYKVL